MQEFLAPQGRKDNKEKMELRGRDREAWRGGEGKKEMKGHVVTMVHLEWRDLKNVIAM